MKANTSDLHLEILDPKRRELLGQFYTVVEIQQILRSEVESYLEQRIR